ncbi:PAS domain-containing hybrid sensor histidine kinase/response regulator [Spirochaeta isovalerica]|uniref:histidine kinase n=1 Tax=Spirochaeta isovalerica TaxID=150 RepID=A0A841RC21_9SPIO|nr:PAS domain-containing protein [Spirochaeta isovalerica]MBB6479952.1 PAS domain S-box-containing protein [Spirochaeta isovalerica]
MKEEHYLKKELYSLIATDPSIFDFIQEGSLDGIWYWDLENPENEWMSPRFWTILGYDYNRKSHKPEEWQDIINQDDLKIAISNVEKHLADPDHPYDQIVRYMHCNGSTVWIRCRGIAIRDSQGKPIRMLGAHTDLTTIKASEKSLLENRKLLEETSRIAQIGGWEYYPEGDKFIWTPEVYRIQELDPEIIPSLELGVNMYHPDHRQVISHAVQRALENNESFNLELKIITGAGNERWVEAIGRPIEENGKIIGCRGTIQNVTDRKKIQEENERLTAQINHKSRMDALGQITGGVAHDFNNILTGIMSAANLLKIKGTYFDDKCKSYVELILKASDNAARLISKMLTFSRKDLEEKEILDIGKIINETIEILGNSIDKKITLKTNLTREKSLIWGNYISIENMLMNICINASHAMPNGGTIELSCRRFHADDLYCRTSTFDIIPGDYAQITIEDEGEGIPAENLTKIFDPFFTTKAAGKGTGLGLAAVYGIVTDLHGAITVDSELGKGTVFEILIPVTDSSRSTEKEGQIFKRGKGTILLVDDEEINRITGKDLLESLGYSVITAENGEESLSIFKENIGRIDLVIMDMTMPIMNGAETLEILKNEKPDLKAIIATGHAEYEKLNQIRDLGFNQFVKKPYSLGEMSHKIFSMIEKSP